MKRIALLLAALLAGCASPPQRPEAGMQDLLAARRAEDALRELERRELVERFVDYMAAKADRAAQDSRPAPAIDILVISGGGDWGAFGAGVLKGWGRVRGELARPTFDVVTGVSTGALIAPFAFLGDDASIERIVHFYRNAPEDVAKSRGWLFFLPDNPSLFVVPGLERDLRTTFDRAMLESIVAEGASGRGLLVNTTNVDFGDNRPWDLIAEAKAALAGDSERLRGILLASAGIPALFPARDLGEHLYVDGAITGNILYGGEAREDRNLIARWQARFPRRAMPRLRYWVIFNNQLRFPPEVVENRWPAIMARTTIMATQTSTVNSIRHLFAIAEIARLRQRADVEVRLIAVPEDFVPAKPGSFVREVMNDLADIGERMGADPASWRTTPP
jgi:predicted acylesterase/phospholipase RssA